MQLSCPSRGNPVRDLNTCADLSIIRNPRFRKQHSLIAYKQCVCQVAKNRMHFKHFYHLLNY